MRKKLQVFVSSTYTDLREERQAAVEAILEAGHIPAGMELFAAGSESQLEVVKRWIDESDVYMLILGGRYGSIEPNSGKSYTHVEYEYALKKKIPLFAVVMKESAIKQKVRERGPEVLETENPKLLKGFQQQVRSRMCKEVDDAKDIKLAVHTSLKKLEQEHKFSGWVSGREIQEPTALLQHISELIEENKSLRKANKKLQADATRIKNTDDPEIAMGKTFSELARVLSDTELAVPPHLARGNTKKSLAEIFINHSGSFAAGVRNAANASEMESFLFSVGRQLIPFGLIERAKVPSNVYWDKLVTTNAGNRFVTEAKIRLNRIKNDSAPPAAQAKGSPPNESTGVRTLPTAIRPSRKHSGAE